MSTHRDRPGIWVGVALLVARCSARWFSPTDRGGEVKLVSLFSASAWTSSAGRKCTGRVWTDSRARAAPPTWGARARHANLGSSSSGRRWHEPPTPSPVQRHPVCSTSPCAGPRPPALQRPIHPARLLCPRFPGIPIIHPEVDRRCLAAGSPDCPLEGSCQDLRHRSRPGTVQGSAVPAPGRGSPARWVVLGWPPVVAWRDGTWSPVIGSLGDLGYGLAWRVLDAQRRSPNDAVESSLSDIFPGPLLLKAPEPEGGGGHPAPVRSGAGRCPMPHGWRWNPSPRWITDGPPRTQRRRLRHALTFQKVVRCSGDGPPEVWDHPRHRSHPFAVRPRQSSLCHRG